MTEPGYKARHSFTRDHALNSSSKLFLEWVNLVKERGPEHSNLEVYDRGVGEGGGTGQLRR